MQARKLTLVEIGVGGLPSASPVAPRFSTWFPVPFKAPDVPPANGVNPTPVADGVVLEWDAVDLEGVVYVISRSESQDGPWTEIHRTTETRYVYSDGSGKTWWFQITPTMRGKTGTGTVVGVVPPTTSKDLAEQQAKLAAEISARIQAIADEAAARGAGLAQAAQDLVAEALLRQQGVTEAMQAISAEA
ncbi:sialidase family protein, partial [Stenotrophomonas maltophilia]|uniref:sialidase family protein n=2 Tax=Stenotrophomonas maltophilia TaxID=40324 RepID=UPI001FA7B95A